MNAANIVAIVVAFIAMLGTALTLWVSRTDRATKLNRENMDSVLKDSRLMRAFRDDLWAWERWGHSVQQQWHTLQVQLQTSGAIDEINDLPPRPDSEVRKLEQQDRDG